MAKRIERIRTLGGLTRRRFVARFLQERAALVATGVLAVLVLIALLAPVIAPYDPVQTDLRNALQGPSAAHVLGTDHLGRDVFSRLVFAARISFAAAFIAVAVAIAIGVPLGLVAGYLGGWWDRVIMRVADAFMALPGLVLALAFIAVLGRSFENAMLALGFVFAPAFLRLMRGSTLAVKEEDYVNSARTLGLPGLRIVLRYVLPNAVSPVLIQTFIVMGFAMLAEAGLSFIGLGVQPPDSSWGKMLAESSSYLSRQPFLVLPPGLAITISVLAFNFIGDGARDALSPRSVHRAARARSASIAPAPAVVTPVSAQQPEATLVSVEDLAVTFSLPGRRELTVVEGLSFGIAPGETVALVGESGSGKSMTALSIMGLVPQPGRARGRVMFEGRDLLSCSENELSGIRGLSIGMIFQEPSASLDPVFTIGDQVSEPLRKHLGLSRSAARRRAIELLDRVGIAAPHLRIDDYPHQYSGGMAQRAMIAMAISCGPKLLIADEPTTALDVTIQAEILELLRGLQTELDMSMLLITHDMGIVAEVGERVITMYAGQIVETARVDPLFERPRHPYTSALLTSLPQSHQGQEPLPTIPGEVPNPGTWPLGCRFAARCAHALAACAAAPVPLTEHAGQAVRCIRAHELTLPGVQPKPAEAVPVLVSD